MSAADRARRELLRVRTCQNKLAYSSILAALDELMIRRAEPTSSIRRTYKCGVCGRWHMTSKGSRKQNPYPVTTGRWLVKNEHGKFWVAWSKGEASSMASQNPDWWVEPELSRRMPRHGHKNREKVKEQQWNT